MLARESVVVDDERWKGGADVSRDAGVEGDLARVAEREMLTDAIVSGVLLGGLSRARGDRNGGKRPLPTRESSLIRAERTDP